MLNSQGAVGVLGRGLGNLPGNPVLGTKAASMNLRATSTFSWHDSLGVWGFRTYSGSWVPSLVVVGLLE